MKLKSFLVFHVFLYLGILTAQSIDTVVYNTRFKKIYQMGYNCDGETMYERSFSRYFPLGGDSIIERYPDSNDYRPCRYYINDLPVKLETYIHETTDPHYFCRPCYLIRKEQNKIQYEGLYYGFESIGTYIEYYKNGKIKMMGQCSDISDSVPYGYFGDLTDGWWTFFKKNGDTLGMELWDKGDFVKQVPETNVPELWGIDFVLDGQVIENNLPVPLEKMKDIKFVPLYKNKVQPALFMLIDICIEDTDYTIVGDWRGYTPQTLSSFNIMEKLTEIDLQLHHEMRFSLIIHYRFIDQKNKFMETDQAYLNVVF